MNCKPIWISTFLINPIQKKSRSLSYPKKKKKELFLLLIERTKHFDELFILAPFERRTKFYLHRCDSVYNKNLSHKRAILENKWSVPKIVLVVVVVVNFEIVIFNNTKTAYNYYEQKTITHATMCDIRR